MYNIMICTTLSSSSVECKRYAYKSNNFIKARDRDVMALSLLLLLPYILGPVPNYNISHRSRALVHVTFRYSRHVCSALFGNARTGPAAQVSGYELIFSYTSTTRIAYIRYHIHFSSGLYSFHLCTRVRARARCKIHFYFIFNLTQIAGYSSPPPTPPTFSPRNVSKSAL